MTEMSLREIFEKAHTESHSQDEYWAKIEQLWEKQNSEEISFEDFLHVAFEFIIPMKQEISNGFQVYFASYFRATYNQCNILKNNPNFFHLLPTIYLLHHTIELFFKMVKIDAYNTLGFGEKGVDITNLLLPTSIKDLKLASHQTNKLFDDADVYTWFSFIENGDEQLKELSFLYENIRMLVEMNSLAEEARFPLRKDSYTYIDRSKMPEEKIFECMENIDKILSILSKAYISWHTQDKSKLLKEVMDNVKSKSGGTN